MKFIPDLTTMSSRCDWIDLSKDVATSFKGEKGHHNEMTILQLWLELMSPNWNVD